MGIQGNLLGGKFSKLVWILHYLTCKCLTTQVSKKPFEKKPVKKKKATLCFRKKCMFFKNNVQYVNMDNHEKSDSLLKSL